MKRSSHWHFLSQLPLPVLAGWFLASQPPGRAFVDPLPLVVAQYASAQASASEPPTPRLGERVDTQRAFRSTPWWEAVP
jgi:hypothetical protein